MKYCKNHADFASCIIYLIYGVSKPSMWTIQLKNWMPFAKEGKKMLSSSTKKGKYFLVGGSCLSVLLMQQKPGVSCLFVSTLTLLVSAKGWGQSVCLF